jgi:acyl dehydratase
MRAQFSSPVFPGDTVVVRGWNDDGRVLFAVTTRENPDALCISNAYATLRN